MLTIAQKEKIWEMYRVGASIKEISDALGVDRHTVANELKNGKPLFDQSSVSVEEISTIKKAKEAVKATMPEYAELLKGDEEVSRSAAKVGVYYICKDERRLVEAVKSLNIPEVASHTDVVNLFTKLVRHAAEEWFVDQDNLKKEELSNMVMGTMSFFSVLSAAGVGIDQINKLIDVLIQLDDAGTQEEDYKNIALFLTGLRDRGIDLTKFLHSNDMGEVLYTLKNYKELLRMKRALESEISASQRERTRLLENNDKLAHIRDIDTKLKELAKRWDQDLKLLEELEGRIEEAENLLGFSVSYSELSIKTQTKAELNRTLSEENASLTEEIAHNRQELFALKPRVDYYRSQAFFMDTIVDNYMARSNNGSGQTTRIPGSILKYNNMRHHKILEILSENPVVVEPVGFSHRAIRPRLANEIAFHADS